MRIHSSNIKIDSQVSDMNLFLKEIVDISLRDINQNEEKNTLKIQITFSSLGYFSYIIEIKMTVFTVFPPVTLILYFEVHFCYTITIKCMNDLVFFSNNYSRQL